MPDRLLSPAELADWLGVPNGLAGLFFAKS
jgi:hypothetical protein